MKTILTIGSMVLALSIVSAPALSASWRVLKQNGPVTALTDDDFRIFKKAANKSLNHEEDGVTVSWKNPETGSHGTLTPLTTYQERGTTCRSMKMISHAKGRTGKGFFNFCKNGKNTWKVDIN